MATQKKKSLPAKKAGGVPVDPKDIVAVPTAKAWDAWLAKHHDSASHAWLRMAKKGAGLESPSYAEAVEVALTWGWIDGQSRSLDDQSWLQRYTPRRPRSPWSRINRERAEALIESGRMKPPGLKQVELAKADGR